MGLRRQAAGRRASMRIHLDTDFGGDPDDACALAFLLGRPDCEIAGITTNLDPGGERAGCVAHYLKLAGRPDIAVAAGAGATLSRLECYLSTADDPRYWPAPPESMPGPPGAALDLLLRSIDQGARIVAIGAATNLALLEVIRPGCLAAVPVFFMGGWVEPPAAGLPGWGPEMDWNTQCDTAAAMILGTRARLTLVTLPATLTAHLRAADLPRLRASGPVGELLATQSELHARENGMSELGRAHPGLPDDLLNFHYDPVTCAVALGWPGATVEKMRLEPVLEGRELRFRPGDAGHGIDVVTGVRGDEFAEMWLAAIEELGRKRG
ncbi:MAG: nucleoside hydrolase [bacterium]|nr:nucleoside hydrolase [bacterium]